MQMTSFFNPILLFLQCVRVLQRLFKAVGNSEFLGMWFVFCSPVSPIQGLSLLRQCYLTQHCEKTNRWRDRVIERRRGRDWLLLNTEHQRDTSILVVLITFLSLDHCSRTCGRLGGFLVLVFECIINPALMSCGKDAFSWWSACWAHRWAQTQRSHFLTPPITFVPGAGSKGPTGESSNTRF